MKKIITMALAVMISSASFLSAQDLEEVLDNYFEVVGMDKLAKVESVKMEGTSMQMGMETPFKNITTRSGKYYLEVPVQGQTMIQVYDGEGGWMIAPWTGSSDPIDLPEVQMQALKRQADIDGMLYNYEEKGYETELLGTEDMQGSEVYLIKQTDQDGNIFTHYMDAENFVILKTNVKLQMQGSEIELESFLSNYKPVDGIIMPFSVETHVGGQVQSRVTIENIEFNVPVDDSIFARPKSKQTTEEE